SLRWFVARPTPLFGCHPGLEAEIDSRFQEVRRVVVAVEIAVVADAQPQVSQRGAVGHQATEIAVQRQSEQMRGERTQAVISGLVSVDAVDAEVFLAPEV